VLSSSAPRVRHFTRIEIDHVFPMWYSEWKIRLFADECLSAYQDELIQPKEEPRSRPQDRMPLPLRVASALGRPLPDVDFPLSLVWNASSEWVDHKLNLLFLRQSLNTTIFALASIKTANKGFSIHSITLKEYNEGRKQRWNIPNSEWKEER